MNLLVTGGAGFIGSHFVLRHRELFPQDGIVVLDAMRHGADKAFLASAMNDITFVEGDIADVELVHKLVKQYLVDVIVNFAAETHVDRSIQNAVPFLHSNVIGVQSLIEVCRKRPDTLLMHVSTDEVYGDLQDGERSKRTDDALKPSSPYAASKASGDLLIHAAVRTYGVRARISRCTNNFGPHQAAEKLIPTIIRRALVNQPIPLYAKGENKRDWLYVTDHCDAIEAVIRAKGGDGKVFHVSADSERRNIDVAKQVLALLGKPESLITFVADRPGHDWRYALDAASCHALGWKPSVNFDEGLRRTVEWYQGRIASEAAL
jgi:dTDP-glucose 4,6-dehydratase